jgi:hypothetical protein
MSHLDYIRRGLSLRHLACELTLLIDNVARLFGASMADSIALSQHWALVMSCPV